ncbi:ABC transporter permease [Microbacterium sp. AGC85]
MSVSARADIDRRVRVSSRGTGPRRALLWAALAILAVVAVMALFPQLVATQDPLRTDVRAALAPPSAAHLFGTDQSGRDVFSRVVHGAGRSVGIGLLATALALVIGLVVGALSGIAPRAVDATVMRVTDVLLAFPEFLVALVVVAILGPGPTNVAIAVTIAAVPVYVRLARVQTRSLSLAEHVEAARILGVPPMRAFVRHVVPGVLGSLSVLATIGIGSSILAAAGLSFLGLGPTEPSPEWGLMLSGGRNVLGTAWWIAVFPGVAITLTVVSATIVGRSLRASAEGRAG